MNQNMEIHSDYFTNILYADELETNNSDILIIDFKDLIDSIGSDTIIGRTTWSSLTDQEIQEITTESTYHISNRHIGIKPKRHTRQEKLCGCGGSIEIHDQERVCTSCGVTESIQELNQDGQGVSSTSMSGYNTSNESANPVRVIGPGNNAYQRKLICKTTDYDKTRLRDTMGQLTRITQNYKRCAIPSHIVDEAGRRYYDIQLLGEIKRGNVRRGAMAMCLMKMCEKYGVHHRRGVFAEMCDVDLKDLSEGEKLLDRLIAEGKIRREDFNNRNPEVNRIQGYLIQHFIRLGIPLPPDVYQAPIGSESIQLPFNPNKNYHNFVKRLIEFANKLRVAESSELYSKCAGAIFILATRSPELKITAELIVTECKISKSTFKRFYNIIEELLVTVDPEKQRLRKKLVHLFHVNGISTVS